MRTLRPAKRSVSPFGIDAQLEQPFAELAEACRAAFAPPDGKIPSELRSIEDACFLPALIQKLFEAPANDAPQLENLCHFLLRFRGLVDEKGLTETVASAMEQLFNRKTEMFMIDQNLVLFAKERDCLVGRYFAPLTESHPGLFSEFVTRWTETDNPDRLLHFLDFCAGSKNPTFEHYLLFTHPALHRVIGNKSLLRALLGKAAAPLTKLGSPSWEADTRSALGI